jgi:hypothetical protein
MIGESIYYLSKFILVYPPQIFGKKFTDIAILEWEENIFSNFVPLWREEHFKLMIPHQVSERFLQHIWLYHGRGKRGFGQNWATHYFDWYVIYDGMDLFQDGDCGSPGFMEYMGQPYLISLHRRCFMLTKEGAYFGAGIRIDLILELDFGNLKNRQIPEKQESQERCLKLIEILQEDKTMYTIPWFLKESTPLNILNSIWESSPGVEWRPVKTTGDGLCGLHALLGEVIFEENTASFRCQIDPIKFGRYQFVSRLNEALSEQKLNENIRPLVAQCIVDIVKDSHSILKSDFIRESYYDIGPIKNSDDILKNWEKALLMYQQILLNDLYWLTDQDLKLGSLIYDREVTLLDGVKKEDNQLPVIEWHIRSTFGKNPDDQVVIGHYERHYNRFTKKTL